MSRTTVNIDDPVLKDLRRLQREEKKPLGQLVSELLVVGLGARRARKPERPPFSWTSSPMHARIELEDKEAVWRELDADDGAS